MRKYPVPNDGRYRINSASLLAMILSFHRPTTSLATSSNENNSNNRGVHSINNNEDLTQLYGRAPTPAIRSAEKARLLFNEKWNWKNCRNFSDDWFEDWDDDEAEEYKRCRFPPSAAPTMSLSPTLPFEWSICDQFDDDELEDEDDALKVKCRNQPSASPTPFDFSICDMLTEEELKEQPRKVRRKCENRPSPPTLSPSAAVFEFDWALCDQFDDDELFDEDDDLYIRCRNIPSMTPTKSKKTEEPTSTPTKSPTDEPTKSPTKKPTKNPTESPTRIPTDSPTKSPTKTPTDEPTQELTQKPTKSPTVTPTESPKQDLESQFSETLPLEEEEFDWSICDEFDDDEIQNNSGELNIPEKCKQMPSMAPSAKPEIKKTPNPTFKPTSLPTQKTTTIPTSLPTRKTTTIPTATPTKTSVQITGAPTPKPSVKFTSRPTIQLAFAPIPAFTLNLETSETGSINEKLLIDSTTTFLSFQYMKHFTTNRFTYMEMNIVSIQRQRRRLRLLATSTITLEGTAYFTSDTLPSEQDMAVVIENAFTDPSNDGSPLFMNLLKSTQDDVLASAERVSVDVEVEDDSNAKADTGTTVTTGVGAENPNIPNGNNNSGENMNTRVTPMIPIVVGAISALAFLVGAMVLARKYKIFEKPEMEALSSSYNLNHKENVHPKAGSSSSKKSGGKPISAKKAASLPRSEIGSELDLSESDLNSFHDDSFSIASSAYAYSVTQSYTNVLSPSESAFGGDTYNGSERGRSMDEDDESVEEISLDERRFNQILGPSRGFQKPDFKSVWKDAQTPSTSLRKKGGKHRYSDQSQNTNHTYTNRSNYSGSSHEEQDLDNFSDIASDFTGLSGLNRNVLD